MTAARRGQAVTLVVLGAAVWPGGVASPSLRRRACHAARLWKGGGVLRIVTTGGVGQHPPAEAEVAAAVLRDAGVPADAILCESRSRSTFENIVFARDLLPDSPGPIVLVSDSYHLPRARLIARLAGLEATAVAPPHVPPSSRLRRLWMVLREALALPLAAPMTWWRLSRLARRNPRG